MFELIFKKYFKKDTFHIFVFSFLVFIVLNVIENVIHYNIGKYHDNSETRPDIKTIKLLVFTFQTRLKQIGYVSWLL